MKWKTLAAAAFLVVVSAIPVASQTLTVSVTGNGYVSGTGISCGSDCSETVRMTTSMRGVKPGKVVLTANGWMAASGPNWGGACQGTTGPTCTVTVPPGGAVVSAGFETITVTDLSDVGSGLAAVSTVGPGTVSSSPSPSESSPILPSGTVVTYRAEPNAGASFVGWSGVCTGNNPVCTHDIYPPSKLVASFGWPVTVTIEGPAGGRVTGKGIDCPTVCTVVTHRLILEAISGRSGAGVSVFQEWGGACKTAGMTSAVCRFTITGPTSTSARFLKIPVP